MCNFLMILQSSCLTVHFQSELHIKYSFLTKRSETLQKFTAVVS